jgi:SAM-dependent methyltransferase
MDTNSNAASKKEWFKDWFDSPYYHLLYQKHDDQEAHLFIDRLLDRLQPDPDAHLLDLACGKGRFARYLAEKGFEVTGLDLSVHNIEYARQFETEKLSFFMHDMRLPFRINYFDYIFSFFTSFGYFQSEREDVNTLRSAAKGLKKDGVFVLDFFNSEYVKNHLVIEDERQIGDVHFLQKRRIEGRRVIKDIQITDKGQTFNFQENVCLIGLPDFEKLCQKAGLIIREILGDYQLGAFNAAVSPRLILILQR